MSITVWLWVHVQVFFLVFALILRVPCLKTYPIAVVVVTLIFVLWPVGSSDVSSYLLPIIGLLSLTSLLLLLEYIKNRIGLDAWLAVKDHILLYRFSSMIGIFLYPAAMGFGNYDFYNLGFTSFMLPLFLGISAIFTWQAGSYTSAWLLLVVLWFWLLNLGESQNLWDYLVDPWLCLYALGTVIAPKTHPSPLPLTGEGKRSKLV